MNPRQPRKRAATPARDSAACDPCAVELLLRWDRIGVAVRCGLHPTRPGLIDDYLTLGHDLVEQGAVSELQATQRMLQLLLRTALDDALPGYWRSACLEQAAAPLGRMTAILRLLDPPAVDALNTLVQVAQQRLAVSAARGCP